MRWINYLVWSLFAFGRNFNLFLSALELMLMRQPSTISSLDNFKNNKFIKRGSFPHHLSPRDDCVMEDVMKIEEMEMEWRCRPRRWSLGEDGLIFNQAIFISDIKWLMIIIINFITFWFFIIIIFEGISNCFKWYLRSLWDSRGQHLLWVVSACLCFKCRGLVTWKSACVKSWLYEEQEQAL